MNAAVSRGNCILCRSRAALVCRVPVRGCDRQPDRPPPSSCRGVRSMITRKRVLLPAILFLTLFAASGVAVHAGGHPRQATARPAAAAATPFRAQRGQHHARPEACRLRADRPALVRRFPGAVLRVAPSTGRGTGHVGRVARGWRTAEAHRRGAQDGAAGRRHVGPGASPRSVRRAGRHHRLRCRGPSPSADHPHHRDGDEPPMGAGRHRRHLRARQQPVHRSDRHGHHRAD